MKAAEDPKTAKPIRIGALARMTGCSVPTIRYYEEVGLIPHASRRSSGHLGIGAPKPAGCCT